MTGTATVDFAADTAVTEIEPGRFRSELDERWLSLVAIHGGYSAAVVSWAIEASGADPYRPPRVFSAQLSLPPRPDLVVVETII